MDKIIENHKCEKPKCMNYVYYSDMKPRYCFYCRGYKYFAQMRHYSPFTDKMITSIWYTNIMGHNKHPDKDYHKKFIEERLKFKESFKMEDEQKGIKKMEICILMKDTLDKNGEIVSNPIKIDSDEYNLVVKRIMSLDHY